MHEPAAARGRRSPGSALSDEEALSDDEEEEDSLLRAEKGYQLFRGLVLCCCGASFAAIVWCAWDVSA